MGRLSLFFCLAVTTTLHAQRQEERSLGWIQSAETGATITASGASTAIAAQPGDFLFSGDRLDGSHGLITFYYCPEEGRSQGVVYQLRRQITIPDTDPVPRSLAVPDGQSTVPCILPTLEREPQVATVPSPAKFHVRELSPQQVIETLRPFPAEQVQWFDALPPEHRESPATLLALGVLFENADLFDEAAGQYLKLAKLWQDQPRLLKHIQHLIDRPAAARMLTEPVAGRNTPVASGTVYALVVGISKYEQSPVVRNLAYADQDALLVQKYLESARGGRAVIKLLLNDQATSGAIRNQFLDLKRRAGRNDTVWLFVAAHGEMLPGGDAVPFSQKVPSIITHRADPQDVRISSFPMQEAENWMLGKAAPFGRAMIFLDLCHAGHFVEFRNAGEGPAPEYFGIMATHQGPDALAYEHPIFGGGHGAFTYFLLRGLNTDEAHVSGDPFIRAARLASYVRNAVEEATSFHQSPTALGGVNLATPVADLGQPGIPFQKVPLDQLKIPDKDLIEVKKGRRGRALQTESPVATPPLLAGTDPDVQASIDLENRGEQVLLDYLKGDQTPQSEQEFEQGDRIFTAALALQPGSPYLQARASFCRGRVLVFRKEYPAAVAQLERSIRLEPDAAYAYNALGIAYLEAADYDRAQRAFQDAIGRAPLWAYPRHNLALAYAQRGQYNAAIVAYRAAMDRAASYFYLPYNLGLLYARLNRQTEAEEMYRRASRLAPGRAEPLTALAQLDAVRGNDRRARRALEAILQMSGQSEIAMQVARHNHALLLAKNRKSLDQALAEWKLNGDYLPSQFSVGQALVRSNRTGEAVDQYRHILTLAPDSVAARLELVGQMQKAGASVDELARVLEAGISPDSPNPVLYERLGGLYRAAGRAADARAAYRAALDGTNDPNAHKRIEGILKGLPE